MGVDDEVENLSVGPAFPAAVVVRSCRKGMPNLLKFTGGEDRSCPHLQNTWLDNAHNLNGKIEARHDLRSDFLSWSFGFIVIWDSNHSIGFEMQRRLLEASHICFAQFSLTAVIWKRCALVVRGAVEFPPTNFSMNRTLICQWNFDEFNCRTWNSLC